MPLKRLNSNIALATTKLVLAILPAALSFMMTPQSVAAASTAVTCEKTDSVGTCVAWSDPGISVGTLLTKVFGWVILLVGGVAVLFIIYGGLQYVTSGGNKDRAEAAKKTILYATIGLVVIVLARIIISLVTNTAGSILNQS
ncbi:MAG: pilin [Bacillota bacterium]|nr:pilin [Bacillota bacterium]